MDDYNLNVLNYEETINGGTPLFWVLIEESYFQFSETWETTSF